MAGNGPHRTTPGDVYMRRMGKRLKDALQAETVKRSEEAKRNGIRRKPEIMTLLYEMYETYGLLPRTVQSYMTGDRRPGMVDLRTLAQETGHTMEELMQDIPYPSK